jgi:formate hydrogenlyase subunit 6/NADH:ubiquinone oxidoreductase subunit I
MRARTAEVSILDRLLRPLRTGVVASRYPAAPPLLQPATRQLPVVAADRCTRDASCVTVCPTGAIGLLADSWTLDAGRCVFCGACARACPSDAIRLDGGVTLAVASPDGLLHVTRLAPAGSARPASGDPAGRVAPETGR